MRRAVTLMLLTAIIAAIIPAATGIRTASQPASYGAWTPIDAGVDDSFTAGEHFGGLYADLVEPPWLSYAAVSDPASGTVVTAFVRKDVDLANNDYVYVSIMAPVDTDGDSVPDSFTKVVKYLFRAGTVRGVDSVSVGGEKALVTWTYVNADGKDSVGAALIDLNGTVAWVGDVASSSTYYNEFSRSCYVASASEFLIVWYTSDGSSVKGAFISTNGSLGSAFTVSDTNSLYWKRADQMLCIGGDSKALVAFRKYDSNEREPDLYAALVGPDSSVAIIKLYDYNGTEETVGVSGAYLNIDGSGYFLVPFMSGSYVGYSVVSESDASVLRQSTYPGQGSYPAACAAGDRFVMTWVKSDGSIGVGNIDTSNWYIHIATVSDTAVTYHPLIIYDSADSLYLLAYSGGSSASDLDVRYALLSAGQATEAPSILSGYPKTLVGGPENQTLAGLAGRYAGEFVAVYDDNQVPGERNIMAYASAEDTSPLGSAKVYELPKDAGPYKSAVIDLINNAQSEILIAMAFWDEGSDPCNTPGTIANALASKVSNDPSVKAYVIVDNDTDQEIKTCLSNAGVNVIDDSSYGTSYHIMHNKFMVVDSRYLVVATVNFIVSDFSRNNNTAVILDSPAAAHFYKEEFLHMWNNGNGLFGTQKTDDHSFIAFTDYSGRTVVLEAYFTPQYYGVRTRVPDVVHAYISRASSSVRFTAYIFTTSYFVQQVYEAIVNASSRGVDVKGVFDELLNVDTPGRRLYWFIDAGVPVAIDNHPYTMHAKIFTVDDEVAIIGSWNPTYSGTANNDENILVIRDPDTAAGIAKQIADYVTSMYDDTAHFVQPPHHYNPTHPVITKVMYYPDSSGDPTYEWVEIYNPTNQDYDLTWVVIGDSENLIDGDDEGMYKFPDGASLGPHSYAIIAYDAQAFENLYGHSPTYEIAGTDPNVPDLTPYDTNKFTGSWNLSDDGDEVILARSYYGFLKILDAVWWGNSQYMNSTYGQSASAAPLNTSGAQPGDGIVNKYLTGDNDYLDALILSDKYTIAANPQPVPEPWILPLVAALVFVAAYLLFRKKF